MKDEYIIINKTHILERIEELKTEFHISLIKNNHDSAIIINTGLITLNHILFQSSPLIPEIEKAYDAGKLDKELSLSFDNPKGRYVSSLKLDI